MRSDGAAFNARETTHRTDIQGLRAIAVLSVVLYHADERLLPGGFVGVDIFFVISGFLITGILLRELEHGQMSIAGFYQRRIRRLFPALFVMLAATLIAGAVLLDPDDYAELSRTAISTVFFVSNFDFYSQSGYFDSDAASKPLLHTWSLAVEEQFYIFYPLFLALVWTRLRKRVALVLSVGGLIAFAVSVWGAFQFPAAAFYLTPFRAFELSLGALLASRAPSIRVSQFWRDAASCIGALLIAFSFVFYDAHTPFPGIAALAPCMGAALIIFAGVGGRSLAGRGLSLPALTFFGAISYSLYLWHWPLLTFARHYFYGPLTAWQTALLIVAAISVATASWKFIEQPLLKRAASPRKVFAWGAAAMACTSAVAGLILLTDGLPSRFSPQALALFASAEDYNRRRDQCHSSERRPIAYANNCVFGAAGADPIAALWGDSAGAELVVALAEDMAPRGQAIMQITSSGCPPALDYQLPERSTCVTHNDETLEQLVRDDRIRTIIVTLSFMRYPASDHPRIRAGLARAVETLTASGKIVVLAYPFPNPQFEAPSVLGLKEQRGEPLDLVGVTFAQYERENRNVIAFLDALSRRTGAAAFRPVDGLCDRSFCPAYVPGVGVMYFNYNDVSHVSVTGAHVAADHFPFAAIPPATAPSGSNPLDP